MSRTPDLQTVLSGSESLKIERSSTAEDAAEKIRALIVGGSLGSGTPLREGDLSDVLAVSRNTIREALRLLAREGLVDQDRHRMATVSFIEVDDVADIFRLRQVLECGAVDLIAEQGEQVDFERMRQSVAVLENAHDAHWQAIIDADRSFHEALVALAGCQRLSAAYAQLEGEIRRCLSITTRLHPSPESLYNQHRQMLELLEAGQFSEFKERLVSHMGAAREKVAAVLETGAAE